MSILAPDLPGARVLDLYAGSGALGLEALSRGALSVDLVERNPRALAALEKNIAVLGIQSAATVKRMDSLRLVESLEAGAYDLVFADPPYDAGHAEKLVALFRAVPFGRILSVEHPATLSLDGDQTRRYGSTAITFCYQP